MTATSSAGSHCHTVTNPRTAADCFLHVSGCYACSSWLGEGASVFSHLPGHRSFVILTGYNTKLSSANQPGMTAVETATGGPAQTPRDPPAHFTGPGAQGWALPETAGRSTHQLLGALNHGQGGLVAVAVLPARVPVPRLLGEVVARPSVEQPVLGAGRFALDAALGGCREGGPSITARPAPQPRSALGPPPPAPAVVPFPDMAHGTPSQVSPSHSAGQVEGGRPDAPAGGMWEARSGTARGRGSLAAGSRSLPPNSSRHGTPETQV